MFDLSILKIALLAVLAVVVFGPDKLPKMIGDVMNVIRAAQSFARTSTAELARELPPELRHLDLGELKLGELKLGDLKLGDLNLGDLHPGDNLGDLHPGGLKPGAPAGRLVDAMLAEPGTGPQRADRGIAPSGPRCAANPQ